MTGREQHLHELKAIGQRDQYFEAIRQILDQLADEWPIPKGLWECRADIRMGLSTLEQGLKLHYMMQGEKDVDTE